jgi:hypothetical protein
MKRLSAMKRLSSMKRLSAMKKLSATKRLSAIVRKKSVGTHGIPGKIVKLGREAVIPYLARLLDITMYNKTSQMNGKTMVVPISEGGIDR